MLGKVSDLPIRYKHVVFTQKKLDRINFRSGNGGRVLRNPPGVTRCWSRGWSHDSLSHGIDKMADPVMLSIFGVQLLMFVQVVVTFMHVRCFFCLLSIIDCIDSSAHSSTINQSINLLFHLRHIFSNTYYT